MNNHIAQPEISLYTKSAPQGNLSYPVILEMPTTFLIKMVVAACVGMLQYIDKTSPDYVDPKVDNFGGDSGWEAMARFFYPGNTQREGFSGGALYHTLWSQLELIEEYARMRNAAGVNWYVGEEHYVFGLVYKTLVMAHNWQVASVNTAIEKNDANFGSSTGWHKYNRTQLIADWPAKFQVPGLRIDLLPCERPDWEERLRKDLTKLSA